MAAATQPDPLGRGAFDRDTAVCDLGDGRFSGHVEPHWWVLRGANGGYLAAILLNALTATAGDSQRRVRSLTVHFAAAAREGPCEIACRVERSGRSLTSVSARMTQDGRAVALALAAFAAPFAEAVAYDHSEAPELPPAQEVEAFPRLPGVPVFTERFEYRPALGGHPFEPAERALNGGWMRLREPRRLDAPLLAALGDAWFPVVFGPAGAPVAAPTIDYTVHFRHAPSAADAEHGYVRCRFESRLAQEGFWEEDGLLWGASGRLLAHTRQLALALPWTPPA